MITSGWVTLQRARMPCFWWEQLVWAQVTSSKKGLDKGIHLILRWYKTIYIYCSSRLHSSLFAEWSKTFSMGIPLNINRHEQLCFCSRVNSAGKIIAQYTSYHRPSNVYPLWPACVRWPSQTDALQALLLRQLTRWAPKAESSASFGRVSVLDMIP